MNLDLIMANETRCIWLKQSISTDFEQFEQTVQPLLAISSWLRQLRIIKNFVEFAFSEQVSDLGSSFLRVFRRIGNSFFKCRRYPYDEDKTNEWFNLQLPEGSIHRDHSVKALNIKDELDASGECSTILDEVQDYLQSLSGTDYEVLFHGTRHASAQDIIEKGIDVNIGQAKADFSSGGGFYLGDSFDEARKWPKSRGYPDPAVMIFRVKKNELRNDDEKYLDLRNDKKKWQLFVSKFRSGRPDRKFIKAIKKYEFIEGPMASISKNNTKQSQKDDTYQLCVRKDNCAELFDRNLQAVIFF